MATEGAPTGVLVAALLYVTVVLAAAGYLLIRGGRVRGAVPKIGAVLVLVVVGLGLVGSLALPAKLAMLGAGGVVAVSALRVGSTRLLTIGCSAVVAGAAYLIFWGHHLAAPQDYLATLLVPALALVGATVALLGAAVGRLRRGR